MPDFMLALLRPIKAPAKALRLVFEGNGIDCLGQAVIPGGNGVAGIKSKQLEIHLVIHIGPAGMMIHFLRRQCYFGHKSKSLLEIFETKGPDQPLVFFLPHVVGVYLLDACYKTLDIRQKYQVSGHKIQDTEHKHKARSI
jgi:hypothetical protein